jgi:hypothetical protein
MMPRRIIESVHGIGTMAGFLHQIRIGPVAGSAAEASSYVLFAPLDEHNRIDVRMWKEMRSVCRVFKICADKTVRTGTLYQRRGTNWAFQYDGRTVSADDTMVGLDDAKLEPGRSVWLTELGISAEYRVVSLEKVWA